MTASSWADPSEDWARYRLKLRLTETAASRADRAISTALTEVRTFFHHRRGSNCPADIDYGAIAELLSELSRVIELC